MKNKLTLLLLIIIGITLNACYYDEVIIEDEDIIVIPDEQVVSFSDEIQPIFSKCTGCHSGNPSPDLREGNSYNALVPNYVTANDAQNSKLYNYLPGNGHHDIGLTLSAQEIALIKAWIDKGALNN